MSDSFFDEVRHEHEVANDNEKVKIVYATFGLACFWCQCIEESFSLMLIGARIINGNLTSNEEVNFVIDTIEQSKSTMGKLLNEVIKEYSLSDNFKSKLKDILKKRNFITHKFFKEKSFAWYSQMGQIEMLNQLANFIDEAKEIDEALKQHYNRYCDALGISDSWVRETFEKMRLEEAIRN